MRGLEKIFSPIAVNDLFDSDAEVIASKSPSGRR